MYFVWEPSDLPIYPYKVYMRSEAHMFCKGCRAPESPCILYGGPCILYGELKQELKVVVGTVDLAQPYTVQNPYRYCTTINQPYCSTSATVARTLFQLSVILNKAKYMTPHSNFINSQTQITVFPLRYEKNVRLQPPFMKQLYDPLSVDERIVFGQD